MLTMGAFTFFTFLLDWVVAQNQQSYHWHSKRGKEHHPIPWPENHTKAKRHKKEVLHNRSY